MADDSGRGFRILIVDDEDDIRASLKRLLPRLPLDDIRIDEAATGEDAINLLRRNRYDLVLSDHRMARITGVDVLEIALLEAPSTVRVLMTAYEDMTIAQDAVNRARIDGFVRKPWDNRGLMDLVTRLLQERPAPAARI